MSDPLIQENVLLAPYTTLGVGGPARFLIRAMGEEQVVNALDFARERGCPVFILGGGSNIVVADSGFPGLVLKIELQGIQPLDSENQGRIVVAAGEVWDVFVRSCVAQDLAGIECLSGIPGTVGGAPIQNVGAYGEEVSEVILSIRVLDRETNQITELSNAECKFAYRSSIFNTTHENRYVILSVAFALRFHGSPRIHYRDLQQHFWGNAQEPAISEVREAVIQIRKTKAMVLYEDEHDSKSVGSFFKNPILNPDAAAGAENAARLRGRLADSESIPRFPAPEGKVKFPAAWFVEHAGFKRGYAHGNAGISSKHVLALVNRGGATAQEIIDLMRLIQASVYEIFGVELQPEPVFVGF